MVKRPAELAGAVVGSADGCEGQYRDNGRTQQGNGGLGNCLLGRIFRGNALLQLDQDSVNNHDGVINEHAQRDDQGPERNPFEGHTHRPQENKRGQDCLNQYEANQHPASQTHKHE